MALNSNGFHEKAPGNNQNIERLLSLSTFIKNVNHTGNITTLMELTLRSLEAAFDVKKGMFLLYDAEQDVFSIYRTVGFYATGTVAVKGPWLDIKNGNFACDTGALRVDTYFSKALTEPLGTIEGILAAPIHFNDNGITLLGCLVVFQFGNSSIRDAENLLIIEAISNHLALAMMVLSSQERQRRFMMPRPFESFKETLRQKIALAENGGNSFCLLRVSDTKGFVFKENTLAAQLSEIAGQVFPIACNEVFVFLDGHGDAETEKLRKQFEGDDVRMIRYRFRHDFHSFKEFFDIV